MSIQIVVVIFSNTKWVEMKEREGHTLVRVWKMKYYIFLYGYINADDDEQGKQNIRWTFRIKNK